MSGEAALSLETYVKRNMSIVNSGVKGFITEAVHKNDLPRLLKIVDKHVSETQPKPSMEAIK
jgi:hypothetical protein